MRVLSVADVRGAVQGPKMQLSLDRKKSFGVHHGLTLSFVAAIMLPVCETLTDLMATTSAGHF